MTEKTTTRSKAPDTEVEAVIGGPVPSSEPVTDLGQVADQDPAASEDVKVPKGAYVEDLTGTAEKTLSDMEQNAEPRAAQYNDEFQGQGGRYRINPETGDREIVYEKYIDASGETKTRKAA